jgi:hypothetical protein
MTSRFGWAAASSQWIHLPLPGMGRENRAACLSAGEVRAHGRQAIMMTVDAQLLFPAALEEIYDALRARVLELGADVIEEFSRTQVSYGAARKFIWLTPLTKTKALLTVDMWEEHHAAFLRSVIPFRHDKYTHQIEVRTAADIHRGRSRLVRGISRVGPEGALMLRSLRDRSLRDRALRGH